jgi:hypothetical protein
MPGRRTWSGLGRRQSEVGVTHRAEVATAAGSGLPLRRRVPNRTHQVQLPGTDHVMLHRHRRALTSDATANDCHGPVRADVDATGNARSSGRPHRGSARYVLPRVRL